MEITFDKERYLREAADPDYVEGRKAYQISNLKAARELFSKAYKNGNALAQAALAVIEFDKACDEDDYGDLRKLEKMFTGAMEKGNPLGALFLAEMYWHGKGVAKKEDRALELYAAAKGPLEEMCDAGSPEALYQYGCGLKHGLCREDGEPTPEEMKQAISYWEEGVTLGDMDCVNILAMAYAMEDAKKAVDLLERFADIPNAKVHYNLGVAYYDAIGREEDLEKAAGHFQISADAGEAEGQYMLGRFYRKGWGVEEDPDKALQWFWLSAKQGNLEAFIRIADVLIETNLEVDMDPLNGYYDSAIERLERADELYANDRLKKSRIDPVGQLHEKMAEYTVFVCNGLKDETGEEDEGLLKFAFDQYCLALAYGRNSAAYHVVRMRFMEDRESEYLDCSDKDLLQLLEEQEPRSKNWDIARLLSAIYKDNIHGFGDEERAGYWAHRALNKATPEERVRILFSK